MAGKRIMAGICTSPYPSPSPISNWKSRGFPISIPIPSQCGNFPSKRGRVRAISTGTSLFAISSRSTGI